MNSLFLKALLLRKHQRGSELPQKKGNSTPPTRGQTDLTLPEVIAGVVAHFKSRKVSTFVETDVSALIIKGFCGGLSFTSTSRFIGRGCSS
jgi:hypothetical protein